MTIEEKDTSTNEKTDALRLMIIGVLIAEYGARLIVDNTMQEMKQLVKRVIKDVNSIERHFYFHPRTDSNLRETFKREFNKNETALLAEHNLQLWSLDEESLENIVKTVGAHIDQAKTEV